MSTQDFPGNSKAQKQQKVPAPAEPEKKIEPVVRGEVTRRKKPLGKRFREAFFGGSDAQSVWNYVIQDVIVPNAKDMIEDAFSVGLGRMLHGDSRRLHRPSRGNDPRAQQGPYISYGGIGSGRPQDSSPDRHRQLSSRRHGVYDFEEIIFPSRAEADVVLDRMMSLVAQYEMVTVADLYELVRVQATPVDTKFGWYDLRGAGIDRLRGGRGFLLDLPRPVPLD